MNETSEIFALPLEDVLGRIDFVTSQYALDKEKWLRPSSWPKAERYQIGGPFQINPATWAWEMERVHQTTHHMAAIEVTRLSSTTTRLTFADGRRPYGRRKGYVEQLELPVGELFTKLTQLILTAVRLDWSSVPPTAGVGEGRGQMAEGAAKKKKRKRTPSKGTVDACKEAMSLWLDDGHSRTKASELAGVHRDTVVRRIPYVLRKVDLETRQRWVTTLVALEFEDHLGEFKPS